MVLEKESQNGEVVIVLGILGANRNKCSNWPIRVFQFGDLGLLFGGNMSNNVIFIVDMMTRSSRPTSALEIKKKGHVGFPINHIEVDIEVIVFRKFCYLSDSKENFYTKVSSIHNFWHS